MSGLPKVPPTVQFKDMHNSCYHWCDLIHFICYETAENLLKSDEPVWDATKFTVYGKWMDGWESRRKRTEGYDWCIIKLNIPGSIRSIELDTCHFTGNYSPKASVQACYLDEDSVRGGLCHHCIRNYVHSYCCYDAYSHLLKVTTFFPSRVQLQLHFPHKLRL